MDARIEKTKSSNGDLDYAVIIPGPIWKGSIIFFCYDGLAAAELMKVLTDPYKVIGHDIIHGNF